MQSAYLADRGSTTPRPVAAWPLDERRGWALYQAGSALAYYSDTNPGMIRRASHALAQVLADSSP